MAYTVTFEPKNHGVEPRTLKLNTAKEAWKLVQALRFCDEEVIVNFGSMDWQQLRALAEAEN